jgi:hypothetical protein
MSQKWAYHSIKTLSEWIHINLLDDIQCYPWFGCHDNINFPFKIYEQRMSNQLHFDSGTATTILIIKNPSAIWLNNQAYQQQKVLGTINPIIFKDIIKLKKDASPHLKVCAVHQVLMYLTTVPAFNFETYTRNKHALFSSSPIDKLPISPKHVIC